MQKKKKKLTKAVWKSYGFCFVMLLPVLWGIFHYCYVNIQYFMMAFQTSENSGFSINNWKILFYELTNKDSTIWLALSNTFKYWAQGMIKIPLAFIIAYFLYKKIWGHQVFRVVFFFPSMISGLILVTAFKDIIKVGGPLYTMLYKLFGYELPNLITSYETATPTMLVYMFWIGFGMNLLIFMGAMKRVDDGIIDAAKVDGCNALQEFIYIILPMCWHTFTTAIMLTAIGLFTASGPILLFTGGEYGTNTLTFWIFDQVRDGTYYYPSTVGLFFTLVALPFVLGIRYLLSKGDKNVE